LSHHVSRCLTSLAPQPLHSPGIGGRFPWSQRFDRIFRNEGVGGSNPPSSTKRPGQSVFLAVGPLAGFAILVSDAPQTHHRIRPLKHLPGREVALVMLAGDQTFAQRESATEIVRKLAEGAEQLLRTRSLSP